MLLDRAYADTDIRGNLALGLAVEPEAAKNDMGPLGQLIQHALQDRKLLVRDELRFGRWPLVQFPRLVAMDVSPGLLAAHAPLGRAAMKQEVIVRHAVQISARLVHRTDLL